MTYGIVWHWGDAWIVDGNNSKNRNEGELEWNWAYEDTFLFQTTTKKSIKDPVTLNQAPPKDRILL